MTSSNLEAAQRYAQLGWRVFPVYEIRGDKCSCGATSCAAGKHPRTQAGHNDATDDPVQITQWWSTWPLANIGVATGSASGILVFDFDGEAAVKVSMAIGDAATVRSETGSGGRHLFFQYPDRPTGTRQGVAPGVDIRASGGYVVVAPSNHRSGNSYRWLRPPDGATLQPVPTDLEQYLREIRPKELPGDKNLTDAPPELVRRASRYLDKIPGAISGRGGHTATFLAAQHLVRGFTLRPGQAYQMMMSEWNHKCQPPWSPREIKHKIESAFLESTTPFGYLLEVPEPAAPVVTADQAEEKVLEAEIIDTNKIKASENAALWARLETTAHNLVRSTLRNVSEVLKVDRLWGGIIRLDTFTDQVFWVGVPPLDGFERRKIPSALTEDDYLNIICWLSKNYDGLNPESQKVYQAVRVVAGKNPFHQVKDYLEATPWDGVPRIHTWLRDYMGAEDDQYTSSVGSRWLISAVARIYQPGCEAHHVLVLESEEGTGKSRAFEILGRPWTRSNMPLVGSKDSYIQLRGAWIIELAELASVTRADSESVKAFLSSPRDAYRKPFAIDATDVPRQCVFGGSTNLPEYLKSDTGNRRFWPVKISDDPIKLSELEKERDQIWAEALAEYRTGAPWWIDVQEKALADSAKERQLERLVSDPWDIEIDAFLKQKLKEYASLPRNMRVRPPFVTTSDVCVSLGIELNKRTHAENTRIGIMMRRKRWHKTRVRGADNSRYYAFQADDRLWMNAPEEPCMHMMIAIVDGRRQCTREDCRMFLPEER